MKVFAQEVQVNGWQKTGSPLGNLQKAVAEACGDDAPSFAFDTIQLPVGHDRHTGRREQ